MSNYRSSLALAEVQDPVMETELDLVPAVRHLSKSNVAERQPMVVKVSGTITISF